MTAIAPVARPARRDQLTRRIRLLVAATMSYNIIEAVIAVTAGTIASSTALIAFGLDSVIEVSSAAAVAWQFSARDPAVREARERTALRIIAVSFFALATYVTADTVRVLAGDAGAGHSVPGIARRIQPVVATPRSRRFAMGRGRNQLPEPPAGARRHWAADRALRPPMRSPGRPEPSRAVQREFWRLIASGVTTVEAAEGIGVSWPVGARWFRHAGGMPPLSLDEPTGRYLSFAEREEIALLRAQDAGVREIARRIGRDPGTISRELRRNAASRSGKQVYRALVAQWKAQQAAKRPKTAKLADNDRLREYVQERLSGSVRRPDGTIVAGPRTPAWKGLNKPHRQDRRWATAWSPEQISNRLKVEFPDDKSMRISHEAIYQALFIEGRGALRRELVACLRTGRALREPRARSRNKPQGHVTADVVIS